MKHQEDISSELECGLVESMQSQIRRSAPFHGLSCIQAAWRWLGRSLKRVSQRTDFNANITRLEDLELRNVLSNVSIVIDYSLDTNEFFDTPLKRNLMQSAADAYSAVLTDSLLAISPSGSNRWSAGVNHPGTGEGINFDNLVVPENTIIVYAGARALQAGVLAIGGPAGFSPSDLRGSASFTNAVTHRGQVGQLADPPTDFGPWGGFVSFNNQVTDWFFGTTAAGIGSTDTDFYSVALHELGHVLGFGTADSFFALTSHGDFTGAKAVAAYDFGSDPPLGGDEAHWEQGLTDEGHSTVMDPASSPGVRVPLTELDLAALDDLGWTLNTAPTGVKPRVVLPGNNASFARGGSPVQLDANAQFTNPDGLSLSGAQLQVSISLNRAKTDRIGVLALNGVKLQGKKLLFNGIAIGSNLAKKGELRIAFNAQASDLAIQSVLRNLTFSTSKTTSAAERRVSVQVTNIEGQSTTEAQKSIQII